MSLLKSRPRAGLPSSGRGPVVAMLLALMAHPTSLRAQETPGADLPFSGAAHWRLAAAPYTAHFRPSDEHEYVWAVGLERAWADEWLIGGSFFSNSFGQDSGYVYVGRTYPGLLDWPQLYWQWTAGLMYGYRGEYKDKVPFNNNGFSPGAVIALGWRLSTQSAMQVNLLGNSALMLQLSHDFR
jgi:hypothetical protein